MSETIKSKFNNYDKIINFTEGNDAEVPPFDLAAAEDARKQRIAEYKAEHPEAVDDINKAYAMAKAGDKYETEAANLRAKGHYDNAKVSQTIANMVEEATGENYDKSNGKRNPQQKAS